jgi:hypothetical protein
MIPMANLIETPGWEQGVYQLEPDDKAIGGSGGVANYQATQLANRTQYLRSEIESVKDSREFTFIISATDLDGTIAGISGTKSGSFFRVAQGPGKGLNII